MPPHAGRKATIEPEDLLTPENVNDRARVIASEARGVNETEQAVVGWTVVNRLKKYDLTHVSEVWDHYAHGHFPTATSLRLAEGTLGGTAMDISQGATHFYNPSMMPKAGEGHAGIDVGGDRPDVGLGPPARSRRA